MNLDKLIHTACFHVATPDYPMAKRGLLKLEMVTNRKATSMKRITALMLGLMILVSNVAQAQEDKPIRSISVSGTVETKTAPDQIVWRISLTDTDMDMRKAKVLNDDRIKSVVALRQKLGVNDGDFETGSVSIRRDYERDQMGRRGEFKGFVVSRGVTIRQRDLKRFDEFLDSLVSSTDMEVSFSFESSNIQEVRAETRLKALQAAKDKATAMAGIVGAKLGRVLTINEHAPGDGRQSFASNSAFVQSTPSVDLATDKFVPGAIPVQVTVYATFELE